MVIKKPDKSEILKLINEGANEDNAWVIDEILHINNQTVGQIKLLMFDKQQFTLQLIKLILKDNTWIYDKIIELDWDAVEIAFTHYLAAKLKAQVVSDFDNITKERAEMLQLLSEIRTQVEDPVIKQLIKTYFNSKYGASAESVYRGGDTDVKDGFDMPSDKLPALEYSFDQEIRASISGDKIKYKIKDKKEDD